MTINIDFGQLAPPFADQLYQQGYHIPDGNALTKIQRAAASVTYLRMHEFITDLEACACERRIARTITDNMRPTHPR